MVYSFFLSFTFVSVIYINIFFLQKNFEEIKMGTQNTSYTLKMHIYLMVSKD